MIRHLLLSAILLAGSVIVPVAVKAINPVTQAMLGVYDRLIKEDPKDYETLFRRANEYYKLGRYEDALADIDGSLRYVPLADKDLRAQSYALRGNIYLMMERKDEARQDFSNALAMNPDDFATLYQRALIDLEKNNLAEAASGFRKMQSLNPRSTDALFGLARVEIKKENLGIANDMMNSAVDIDKTNPNVFLRRSAIRRELGNRGGAVEDILIAISLDSKNSAAFRALTDMASEDYPAVVAGLSEVIAQAPDNGMYYYIRGTLALEHGYYHAAETDFRQIIDRNLYDYQGIYRSLALAQYHQGNFKDALDNINHAIYMSPDNKDYLLLKAKILIGACNEEEALENVRLVLRREPDNEQALELLKILM